MLQPIARATGEKLAENTGGENKREKEKKGRQGGKQLQVGKNTQNKAGEGMIWEKTNDDLTDSSLSTLTIRAVLKPAYSRTRPYSPVQATQSSYCKYNRREAKKIGCQEQTLKGEEGSKKTRKNMKENKRKREGNKREEENKGRTACSGHYQALRRPPIMTTNVASDPGTTG